MSSANIPFNRPYLSSAELDYVSRAFSTRRLAGDGEFTTLCHHWIEENSGTKRALLTHSCTAALELAALLLEIREGDEVIMPSYTFVSTANAFVLRGGVPVFVDVRADTLNIDETLIEAAITERTRAIVPVHYAGVACEMDAICDIAQRHGLPVIEDAAQGVGATYKGKALGSIGDLGAYSFHETKNIVCGEGGALLVNRLDLTERAEIIRQKGTDRSKFIRGEVDKYSWQDVGSSFLPSELVAAFLWAQMEKAGAINGMRVERWNRYHGALERLEAEGLLRRPTIPLGCVHNAHIYYVIVKSAEKRARVLDAFRAAGVGATFHYIPLHSSPAGLKYGRVAGSLAATDALSERLVRLPLYADIREDEQQLVISTLQAALHN